MIVLQMVFDKFPGRTYRELWAGLHGFFHKRVLP